MFDDINITINLTDIIPWVALIIASFSLFVNIYRIYRDRNKLVIRSELIYKQSINENRNTPTIVIYVINIGLRPIRLVNFGIFTDSKNNYNEMNIKTTDDQSIDLNNDNINEEINNIFLAHNNNIKLEDGDIYEMNISYNDFDFYMNSASNYAPATGMYFKDILGKKYYIKGIKKNIEKLIHFNKDNK